MIPKLVILQNVQSVEARTCRLACLQADIPTQNASLMQMQQQIIPLDERTLVVGSVEFVVQALRSAKVPEPVNLSYVEQIQRFLRRKISTSTINALQGRSFVKPLKTKAFTGFVYDSCAMPQAYSEADRESLREMLLLPGDTRVWTSEVVEFLCEWRYYVNAEQIVGRGRYDDRSDDAPAPDESVVNECISAMGLAHPYTLDFGVLRTGQTALVEANDAWSIGLYENALTPRQYLQFLADRWASIFAAKTMG